MKNRLRVLRVQLFVGLLLVVSAFHSVIAAVPDICMQSTGGLAGVPILDGTVTGDAGWNGAVQLNLSGDLGGSTASKLLLGRANYGTQDSLFIGLVVDAPNPSTDTTVVLGFIPDNATFGSDWRLHIKPFATAGAQATYWHNTSSSHINWNSGAAGTTAVANEWPLKNLSFSHTGNHWELELVIPIAAVPAGISLGTGANPNFFKMYTNVMNTVLGSSPSTGQDVWPPFSILSPGPITQNTPDPNTADKWSTVWLQSAPQNACTGVKLEWANVGVQDPNDASKIVNQIQRVKNANISQSSIPACDALSDNANSGLNGALNIFVAKPENTMTGPAPANVSVTFRMADWGIPGVDPNAGTGGTPHWQQAKGLFKPLGAPVPSGCDPTVTNGVQCAGVPAVGMPGANPTAEGPINGGQFGTYRANWSLNYKQSCFYKFTATPTNQGTAHQCMQVDMDSTDPNTRFLNRSVQANMDFVDASTVKRLASISGDQGALPPGKTSHRFLLQVDLDEQGSAYGGTGASAGSIAGREGHTRGEQGYRRFRDKQLDAAATQHFGEGVDHMLSWIVRGYVYTGDKIIIDGNAYEYVRRVGDFGIVAGHQGPITGWTTEFRSTSTTDGAPMRQVAPGSNLYALEVAPGHQATVETTIVAEEAGGGPGTGTRAAAIWLALGSTFPNGSFSNNAKSSLAGNIGFEYPMGTTAAIEGTIGLHQFQGKNGAPDIDVTQVAVNGKWYFPQPGFKPFVTLGLGAYAFDPGSTRLGLNAGAGVQYDIAPQWSIEGRYGLHAITNNSPNSNYSTLLLGLRYAF